MNPAERLSSLQDNAAVNLVTFHLIAKEYIAAGGKLGGK